MSKINTIIQDLKSLTLLEASELVKEIEDVFGVDASVSTTSVLSAGPSLISSPDVEAKEQTEFSVSLDLVPAPKKIAILKVVRSLTGLGLIEAKKLVESSPTLLKESVSKDDAEDIKAKIEEAGGTVVIK